MRLSNAIVLGPDDRALRDNIALGQPATGPADQVHKPALFGTREMTKNIETTVLIIGGAPVGMTLAIDLAWRGVDVTVVEARAAGQAVAVKCNQISSRSMEVFRRLGLADKLREAGLPEDYPVDVVSATTVTGIELSRLSLPP